MTKKYTVASSMIVRKIPGRPSHGDNPVPKLAKITTEKAVASKSEVALRGKCQGAGDQLPKNRESVMYIISKRGALANSHSR